MLFVLFLLFIYLLLEKKKNIIQFWVFIVSKLFTYIFFFFKIDLSCAFDYVCCKLLYGCPSLDYSSVTFNMFAVMFFSLKINFNVMFLFYSKSVIHFHQREIAIVSFSCRFIWWTKFHFNLYSVCQFIDRCQWSSLTITESFLFFWMSYQSIGNHFFLEHFEAKGDKFVVFLGGA